MGGSIPDWYPTVVFSREVGRPPWEVSGELEALTFPCLYYWQERIFLAKSAELEASHESSDSSNISPESSSIVRDKFGVGKRMV